MSLGTRLRSAWLALTRERPRRPYDRARFEAVARDRKADEDTRREADALATLIFDKELARTMNPNEANQDAREGARKAREAAEHELDRQRTALQVGPAREWAASKARHEEAETLLRKAQNRGGTPEAIEACRRDLAVAQADLDAATRSKDEALAGVRAAREALEHAEDDERRAKRDHAAGVGRPIYSGAGGATYSPFRQNSDAADEAERLAKESSR